jgi:hypothetical protein
LAQPATASGAAEPIATPQSHPQSGLSCSLTLDDTTYGVGSDGSFENFKKVTAEAGARTSRIPTVYLPCP